MINVRSVEAEPFWVKPRRSKGRVVVVVQPKAPSCSSRGRITRYGNYRNLLCTRTTGASLTVFYMVGGPHRRCLACLDRTTTVILVPGHSATVAVLARPSAYVVRSTGYQYVSTQLQCTEVQWRKWYPIR